MQLIVGAFTGNGSTGNQSITGFPFEGDFAMFFAARLSTESDFVSMVGVARSSSLRGVVGARDDDDLNTSNTARTLKSDKCIEIPNAAGSGAIASADFVGFTSDGLTVNWTTASTRNYLVCIFQGFTDCDIGVVDLNTTDDATITVSGLSFDPTLLMIIGGPIAATEGVSTGCSLSFGMATASAQWASVTFVSDNQAANISNRAQRTDRIFLAMDTTDTIVVQTTFSQFISGGFELTNTDAPGATRRLLYVALRGGQHKLGTVTQLTSPGTGSITDVGFGPVGLVNASFCAAATTSGVATAIQSFGVVDSIGGQLATVAVSTDATDPMESASRTNFANAFVSASGATPTETAIGDVTLTGSGFDVDWTTADATARQWVYWALGAIPSGNRRRRFFMGAAA